MRYTAYTMLLGLLLAGPVRGQNEPIPAGFGFETVTVEEAAMRDEAFVLGDEITTLAAGDTVRVLNAEDAYLRIEHEGQVGYVLDTSVELTKEQKLEVDVQASRRYNREQRERRRELEEAGIRTVVLRAGGNIAGKKANITYSVGETTQQVTGAALPWQTEIQAEPGDTFSITVQNLHRSGTVQAVVELNGEVVKRASGSGAYANASLSYTVDR